MQSHLLKKKVADFINFLKSRKLLKRIDPEQAYFWTKEWQEGEREADEDIRAGRVSKAFDTAEEAVKALKSKVRRPFPQYRA